MNDFDIKECRRGNLIPLRQFQNSYQSIDIVLRLINPITNR